MKWFKHETEAHSNLKLQAIIDKLGLEAFGLYWFLLELVGKDSEDFHIKSTKNWKIYVKKFAGISEEKLETCLREFAEVNLIDKKQLKLGNLYIPKLQERSDDYTKRIRRKYEQSTDNVHLEQNRTEQKRIEEIKKQYPIKTF